MAKTKAAGAANDLLIELLTEELPPKALSTFDLNFHSAIFEGLGKLGFVARTSEAKPFATPRRLATLVRDVLAIAPDRTTEVSGPPVNAPDAAVSGFAKKHGVTVYDLARRDGPKAAVYVARVHTKGAKLEAALPGILSDALK